LFADDWQLKTAISREIQAIPQDILRCIMEALPHSLEQWVWAGGGHLEDISFKVHWCLYCPYYSLY
jgi:hypothetical protein